ncbi:MAG TPA: VOC family protein [Anaerolineales bacterium]|nr:VOC family protein [Anaerolineales bacterium]
MIRHLAGLAEIVADVESAVHFYREVLGLEVEHASGSLYATVKIPGVLHFGLWGRAAAAESVYGDPAAAHKIPLGFSLGFEVDEVAQSQRDLSENGCQFVQTRREEPWGQVTSRFHSPSGALCEISETPWAREIPA